MKTFVVLVVVVSLSSISTARSKGEMDSEVYLKPGLGYDLCTNESCVEMKNTIKSNMKTDVDPCDDFYEFACGNSKPHDSMVNRSRMNMNRYIAEILMKPLSSSDSRDLIDLKKYFRECLESTVSIEDNSMNNSSESDDVLRCVIKVKKFHPLTYDLFRELDQHYLDESNSRRATNMFNLMIEEFVHKINTNQISWLQNEDSKSKAIKYINGIRLVFGAYRRPSHSNDLGPTESTTITCVNDTDTGHELGGQYHHGELTVHMNLASMLSREFIDSNRPLVFDYAILGSIMGHEINHSVDTLNKNVTQIFGCVDESHCSDQIGITAYMNRTGCLKNQYDGLPFNGDDGKPHFLDGDQTLSENIADNWGYKLNYDTYVKTRGVIEPEIRLPELENFTERQLYWLSQAALHCIRPECHPGDEEHSPWKYRVNYSLKNNPDFARDFGCPFKKSPMSPPDQCPLI